MTWGWKEFHGCSMDWDIEHSSTRNWELGTSLRIEEISFNLFWGGLKQVICPICVTEHQGPWFLDIAPKNEYINSKYLATFS